MNWIKKLLPYLILVSLGAYFYTQKSGDTLTEYIKGDSIFTTIYVDSLIPYDTVIYNTDTLWLHDTINTHSTDTVYVYNDFFKMYEYKIDTNINEVDIFVNTKITQNRLYKQYISAKNNRQTKIVYEEDNPFGIGIIVGVGIASPTFSYKFNNHQVGVGYNFNSSNGLILTYQYKFKIK